MQLSEDEKFFISGANSNIKIPAKLGIVTMPGKGIYMSTLKQYVIDYYSGHEKEAVITFEFNENEITDGNLTDREPEFAVKTAKIVNIEKLISEY